GARIRRVNRVNGAELEGGANGAGASEAPTDYRIIRISLTSLWILAPRRGSNQTTVLFRWVFAAGRMAYPYPLWASAEARDSNERRACIRGRRQFPRSPRPPSSRAGSRPARSRRGSS